jgi:2-polyprenyl-3-methyl-5-hydroxy-6-metoxy-1,4-benzoquinol methylase
MNYPINIVPNPTPLFYFKKRKLGYYGDHLQMAGDNEHEQITNILNIMYPDRAIRILDIACGEEALGMRIRNSRREKNLSDEIISVDIASPKLENPFLYYKLDLNDKDQFDQLTELYPDYFDVILGLETIEHLDNPKMYLSSLKKMLSGGGYIFISIPNIDNPMGRRLFYKHGRIEQFSEKDLGYGHINVILPHILKFMASSIGLKLIVEYSLGLYPKFWLYPSLRSLYITFCNVLMLRVKGSWVKLYIFNKCD